MKYVTHPASDPVVLTRIITRRSELLLFSLVLIVAIVGAGIGFYLYHSGKDLFGGLILGTAGSLVAYVIASCLHDGLVRKHAQEAVDLAIRDNISNAFQAFSEKQSDTVSSIVRSVIDKIQEIEKEGFFIISRKFTDFLPRNVFPPSNTSSPRFMQSLHEGISNTREFYFKGVTARHVPFFLKRANPTGVRCYILILDPRLDQQLWLYAQNRYAAEPDLYNRRYELVESVKLEIYGSIVALFDCASMFSISVKVHSGPVYYRTEMFDDRALSSFYVGSTRTTYPISYEYSSSSFYYKAFERDIRDAISLSKESLEGGSDISESRLNRFLKTLNCNLSLEELRAQFQRVASEVGT